MKISSKKGVHHLIQALAENGIADVVLSPGSRNAPLSLSFENSGQFNVRVIPDERVAAYFALGISMQTNKPSILCCTSGTAVLNYAPAIAEAYYQRIPLIVITADRPAEWIDQGDGQTIRQNDVFKNFIEKGIIFPGDICHDSDKEKLNDLLQICSVNSGPVHINVPLEEPLYGITDFTFDTKKPEVKIPAAESFYLSKQQQEIWQESKKILVLAGQMKIDSDWENGWANLFRDSRIAVLSENISNIYDPKIISCIDRCIDGFTEEEKEIFSPDLLITAGDIVVSKKVKAWLRKYKPKHHWKTGSLFPEMNTYQLSPDNLKIKPSVFIHEISKNTTFTNSNYQNLWLDLNNHKLNLHQSFMPACEWSDLKVFSILVTKIPSHSQLHLGNSSPIRYAQLFDTRNDLTYFSNRGVSGIDGCTSTAAGMANASDKLVTLISGDISFFYDSNAFWNDYLKNLKVIVINNGGGGIFRIIDQPENIKDTEKLFETRHQRKARGIATAFGLNYLAAEDELSLEKAVKQLYADNLPTILEIFTPTEKNPLILKNYFTFLKNK
jgi:2-succinyl-5-enolpyruvyl-6-hydroxy-3-cyclohexene-1-carboxylate synthase